MIEIKKFNPKDLNQYIHSEEFKDSAVIPISYHRAISQINNPRAQEDDDILLFVAYEDGQIAGYLGALPDDYFTKHNAKVHLAWMSCLWVDPAHRGKKIAQKLIQSCFKAWDNRIILTEFTTEAGSLYQKINLFDPWLTLKGRRWYIQSDLAFILPTKHFIFQKLDPPRILTSTIPPTQGLCCAVRAACFMPKDSPSCIPCILVAGVANAPKENSCLQPAPSLLPHFSPHLATPSSSSP